MTRRKSPRSDLPVLLLWLLVGYLVYKADPAAGEMARSFVQNLWASLTGHLPQ